MPFRRMGCGAQELPRPLHPSSQQQQLQVLCLGLGWCKAACISIREGVPLVAVFPEPHLGLIYLVQNRYSVNISGVECNIGVAAWDILLHIRVPEIQCLLSFRSHLLLISTPGNSRRWFKCFSSWRSHGRPEIWIEFWAPFLQSDPAMAVLTIWRMNKQKEERVCVSACVYVCFHINKYRFFYKSCLKDEGMIKSDKNSLVRKIHPSSTFTTFT